MNGFFTEKIAFILGAGLILIGLLIYGEYRYGLIENNFGNFEREVRLSNADLQNKISKLNLELSGIKNENVSLTNILEATQKKSSSLESQFTNITSTVGALEKLSKTDKELLQKYSKVYFLNEHYVPVSLTNIDAKYLNDKDKVIQIHSNVYPYFKKLLDAAATDKVFLQILSSYRAFGEQAVLKLSYRFNYGAGTANQFSAEQGYSEHQLGTTIDFTNSDVGDTFTGFDKTSEYAWLLKNAYKFGFVISYPKNNSYYTYEPWHWRFVGVALASYLHKNNMYFYDMDQREIDGYLASIFD